MNEIKVNSNKINNEQIEKILDLFEIDNLKINITVKYEDSESICYGISIGDEDGVNYILLYRMYNTWVLTIDSIFIGSSEDLVDLFFNLQEKIGISNKRIISILVTLHTIDEMITKSKLVDYLKNEAYLIVKNIIDKE